MYIYRLTAQQALDMAECLSYLVKLQKLNPETNEESSLSIEELTQLKKALEEQHPIEELLAATLQGR